MIISFTDANCCCLDDSYEGEAVAASERISAVRSQPFDVLEVSSSEITSGVGRTPLSENTWQARFIDMNSYSVGPNCSGSFDLLEPVKSEKVAENIRVLVVLE